MSSAWLLPEHLADVLPSQARRIENLRRSLIDQAGRYGFELVIPPVLEYLESLHSGGGPNLDLQTFKLVDQLSGRTLGIRPDTTPQVARIDAHILNRTSVTRLCYCGPVLHTLPAGPWASREPLQFGAEIYGHSGLEADLEALELAIDVLKFAGVKDIVVDLTDVRIPKAVIHALTQNPEQQAHLAQFLAIKDQAGIKEWLYAHGYISEAPAAKALLALAQLYGGIDVLPLGLSDFITPETWAELITLVLHLQRVHPDVRIGIDGSDVSGYGYYSGVRYSLMSEHHSQVLVRGGRYDHVGAAFGRNRPAVGFSLDIKNLIEACPSHVPCSAIQAPWSDDEVLREKIRALRLQGHTVVCTLPGHEHETQEFDFDSVLTNLNGSWVLQPKSA